MIWHRANESIEVEPEAYRSFLYPTPVLRQDISDYLYPMTNREIGVSMVIMRTRTRQDSDYPELLMKQAMWAFKHLCEYTDIPDTGTPFYLSITTDMREIALPYLQACNFPRNAIYWFESREDRYPYLSKLDAMRQPSFADVKRLLHIDVSHLIGQHPTQRNIPLIANILKVWTDQPLAVKSRLIAPRQGRRNAMQEKGKSPESPVFVEAARLEGNTGEDQYNYWHTSDPMYHIPGAIFGATNGLLQDTYFNEVVESIAQHSADEAGFIMYCKLMGWTPDDVAILVDAVPRTGTQPYAIRGIRYSAADTPLAHWLMQHKQGETEGRRK